MKSLFMRLKGRKGFTLVECIVALAVFAAFCLMVMMIAAGAQKETKLANDSETELNGLVENVMEDDITRRYKQLPDTEANVLNLNLPGGKSFSITYDLVNGHKNYVLCTCGYFGDNTEFMDGMSCQDFEPWAMDYKCPSCGKSLGISDVTLMCTECDVDTTSSYKNCAAEYNPAKQWTYNKSSGSFICNTCGNANISSSGLDAAVFDDSYMSVSGMAPNAIRYGSVQAKKKEDAVTVIDEDGAQNANSEAYVHVNYSGNNVNPNIHGKYTITIGSVKNPGNKDTDAGPVFVHTKVSIPIPNGYYVDDLEINGTKYDKTKSAADNGNVVLTQPDYLADKEGTIVWTSTTDNTNDNGPTITFKLRNYKTGFSFDYDYQNVKVKFPDETSEKTLSGLAQYWFGLSGNNVGATWPITS